MNNEIKEISVISNNITRDIQEFSRYCKSYIDKCESRKIYMKDGYILRFHSSHNLVGVRKYYLYHEIFETYLKNCITNLQEENEKLKKLEYKFFDNSGDEESFTLEDYLELGNKVYDLQEENEQLHIQLEDKANEQIKTMYLEYKSRVDKAIENIDLVIELIKQQPTEDDTWILNKLNGFKFLLQGEDKND